MNDLLTGLPGAHRSEELLAQVAVPAPLAADAPPGGQYSRAALAMALGLVLFADLLARVPSGARYVARQQQGRQVVFDHGAVRTAHRPESG